MGRDPSAAELPAAFRAALGHLIGAEGLRSRAALQLRDPGMHPANLGATLMACPADAREAAGVLALCARSGVGVVPQGGRTGLAGGAVSRPGELIVSLERLDRIESIEPVARTATAGAGVTLERLEAALAPHGLAVGIDLGARGSATLGGMVATNAGGIEAFRYGTMRQRVLGLEAALPSGEVLDELSRVRKDNAGLALRQLLIGSEGTLGLITRVVLELVPRLPVARCALALCDDLDAAIALMRAIEDGAGAQAHAVQLRAAELMSGNHLALTAQALGIGQLGGLPPAAFALLLGVAAADDAAAQAVLETTLAQGAASGALTDAVLPKSVAEERDLWRVREDWAVDRRYPGGLWFDISVPIDRIAPYLRDFAARLAQHDPTLRIYLVGHLGDGNLHVTVNAERPLGERYEEIAALVYAGLKEQGGSLCAEHGIGTEKREALCNWAGPTRMRLMRAVKTVFDPAGIMNPGKVLGQGGGP